MRIWLHGKMLAMQAQRPEFGYPAFMSKARHGTMCLFTLYIPHPTPNIFFFFNAF